MRIMYRRAIIAEIDFLFRETAKIRPASELHAATVDDQRLSGDEVTFDEIQQGARHVFWRPGRGDQAAVRTAVTALTCIVLRREYGSRRAIIAEIDFLFRETAKIRPASELHAATVDDQRLSGDEVTFDEIQQGARHVFWRPGRGDQAAVRTAVTALTCIVLRREYGSR